MSLRKIYYSLPPAFRFLARKLAFFPADIMHSLSSPGLKPPPSMIYTGGGNFIETGKKFVRLFQDKAELKSSDQILDIGSGIGRMAIPLTEFVNEKGSYVGFDAIPQGVRWCQENISSKHSNFRFDYIPLKNDLYRKDGIDPVSFSFPYEENSFDFCFLISVFTHMLPDEIDNYLNEIKRVLNKNGVCFATFFIMNDDRQKTPNNQFNFPHNEGHYHLMDAEVKAANVAYNFDYLNEMIHSKGFKVEQLNLGNWNKNGNQSESWDFQDCLVIRNLKA